ncbi:hypothetical protein QQS21_000417 [Conoideocrella luteorostrata]|uniref:Enoyl reductase (ER) domain-containing protein n=1 Tax=Conoideocrella luteorostrata TaxID=1105319 RepID=A0AAJ0FYG7_9HYPO|nr:hypothetical protein QQS21_000417 [Conoideocrella luteorostrata]
MASMQAWQIPSRSGDILTNLTLNTVPQPLPRSLKPTDILIKVISASLNPADHKVPEMGPHARLLMSFPKTPAMDLAGQVVAVGSSVTDISTGDHVVARVDPLKRPGGLSEYVIAQRDGYAKITGAVAWDVAAAVPTAGLTALQNIQPYVKAGDKIFINSGSGGTGTYMIQIAKLLGCHVTVSCSTQKAHLCKALGADDIIDYKTTDVIQELTKRGRVFNLILDNVGDSPPNFYTRSAAVMLPDAVYVYVSAGKVFGDAIKAGYHWLWPSFLGGGANKVVMYITKSKRTDLETLAGWLNEGKLTSMIDKTFEFGDAKGAFEYLKKGSTAGKIVLHVGQA